MDFSAAVCLALLAVIQFLVPDVFVRAVLFAGAAFLGAAFVTGVFFAATVFFAAAALAARNAAKHFLVASAMRLLAAGLRD